MSSADFAVVVPVYNRTTTVLEALDSIAAQSLPPGKVLVVDDGSTDGTARSVHDWIEKSPQGRVHDPPAIMG